MCSLDLKPPVKQQSGETCRRVMQCFSERNIVIYISHFTLRSQGHHVVTSGTGQELKSSVPYPNIPTILQQFCLPTKLPSFFNALIL